MTSTDAGIAISAKSIPENAEEQIRNRIQMAFSGSLFTQWLISLQYEAPDR
jgi:hypothetical protein